MSETENKTALLSEQKVTPQYIKFIRDKYKISQNEMDRRMQYSEKGHMTSQCIHHPDKFLKKRYIAKFEKLVAELEIEHGFYYIVTKAPEIKHTPKRFRITKTFVKCKGHQDYCTWVSDRGYCDRVKECAEMAKNKKNK